MLIYKLDSQLTYNVHGFRLSMAFFKTFRVFKLLTYRTFVYILIWRIFVINLVKTELNNYKVINSRNATLKISFSC